MSIPTKRAWADPWLEFKAITTMPVVAVLNNSLKLWTTHPLPYPA